MQLKTTETILGFKHNFDSYQVEKKIEEIMNRKNKIFEDSYCSKIVHDIIIKIKEANETNERLRKEGDTEEVRDKESQEVKADSSKGLLLCGKKRKCNLKGNSITKTFTPIDLKTLNHTERSFYSVPKQTLKPSEVLSDQMEERLKREIGKVVIQPSKPEEIDPNVKYCICKSAWDGKTQMIECEGKCQNWYHPNCMHITDKELEKIINSKAPWVCIKCKEDSV